MLDLQYLKVPVYSGKNDLPRVPTSDKEGNGSDVIDRYNGLVDIVETGDAVWTIQSSISGGGIYYINIDEKLICDVTVGGQMDIIMPLNPPLGREVSLVKLGADDVHVIFAGTDENIYNSLSSNELDYVNVDLFSQLVRFIFVGGTTGWITTNASAINEVLPV